MAFAFRAFPLTRANTRAWDSLLALNGGASAPWITEAPGTEHTQIYVCCLMLTSEPKRKQTELGNEMNLWGQEAWGHDYTRIAILVPVIVRDGIAMAQGIKRLYNTCPCEHLKGLGITLLALTVKNFRIEYLFLSPIDDFRRYLLRELYKNGIPYGQLGYRSLHWAMREAKTPAISSWLNIHSDKLNYAEGGHFYQADAVYLTIQPQACPPIYQEANFTTGGFNTYSKEYTNACDSAPKPCTLLLNMPMESAEDDEFWTRPTPLPSQFKTHDFLWFLAGDGVMVVHGPSLATLAALGVGKAQP